MLYRYVIGINGSGLIFLQHGHFNIGVAQAHGEGAGNGADQCEGQFFVFLSQSVELFFGEDVELNLAGCDGVIAAWTAIEKGQSAEKVTPAIGGNMACTAGTDRGKYFDSASADHIDRITRFAAGVNRLATVESPFFQAAFQVNQSFVLVILEQLHFSELQWCFCCGLGEFTFAEQAVLNPFDRAIEFGEEANCFAVFSHPRLLKKFTQVAPVRQTFS